MLDCDLHDRYKSASGNKKDSMRRDAHAGGPTKTLLLARAMIFCVTISMLTLTHSDPVHATLVRTLPAE